jgi:hypothetical protein
MAARKTPEFPLPISCHLLLRADFCRGTVRGRQPSCESEQPAWFDDQQVPAGRSGVWPKPLVRTC